MLKPIAGDSLLHYSKVRDPHDRYNNSESLFEGMRDLKISWLQMI